MSKINNETGVEIKTSASSQPACPKCGGQLKKHMNKPAGSRVYCSKCGYPDEKPGIPGVVIQSKDGEGQNNIAKVGTKIISNHQR